MELLLAAVVIAAVIFAGSNGFHDAALTVGNAVVGRAMRPGWALSLAVIFNFIGALLGEGIAIVVANQIVLFSSFSSKKTCLLYMYTLYSEEWATI